jgi:tetratricopeptide (TPR) repeat protein
MTPGLDPFAELAEALLFPQAIGNELADGRFAEKEVLTEALKRDRHTAAGLIGEALDRVAEARRQGAHFDKPRPARLLLAVDQTERLFSQAPKDAEAFGALLQALVGSVAYIVMTLRADAYSHYQACSTLLALRTTGATFDLIPPTIGELEEIVTRPVAACEPTLAFGLSDPPLPQRLVADAKGGDALPLLQMTLDGLFKAQEARGDGTLQADDYKGMAAAVSEAANTAMAHLGDGGRKALEALVAGLVADVAPDPITAEPLPIIIALNRDTFVKGKPDRSALLDAFVEARLLSLESNARVRPTHDALLRIWPEAVNLVKEMGTLIRARHALQPLAEQWATALPVEKFGYVQLSDPLLVSAQQLESRFGDDLGAPLHSFILEALKADADRRRRITRRRQAIFGATLGALAVMTTLAGAAIWQWREAASERVAAERILSISTDAANSLVFDIAHKFRSVSGVPASLIKSVLDQALDLQQKLLGTGQSSGALLRGEAEALGQTSVTLLTLGDSKGSLDAANKANQIFRKLLKSEPDSLEHERGLATSYDWIGNTLKSLGRLPQALESFSEALEIRKKLVGSDPANSDLNAELALSYDNIGDIQIKQGKLSQAFESYTKGLGIREDLAKIASDGEVDQSILADSLRNVGIVREKQGHLAEALDAYEKAFSIRRMLAESNQGDTGLQRSLSKAYGDLGAVEASQGHLPKALALYKTGLAIRERLAKSDSSNGEWQSDLSLSYDNVGGIESSQGQLIEALASYGSALTIRKTLAQTDPKNTEWQRDLSLSYNYVGDVQVKQGKLPAALESYQAALAIREQLAKSDLSNAGWQNDLTSSYIRIGRTKAAQGHLAEALESYKADQAISERLAQSDPSNADWQRDLAYPYDDVGDVQVKQGHLAEALESYNAAFAIRQKLVQSDPAMRTGKPCSRIPTIELVASKARWVSFSKLWNPTKRRSPFEIS